MEMLLCAPIISAVSQKEIIMVGYIARWGHNVLLAGLAIMTYAVFVLAK